MSVGRLEAEARSSASQARSAQARGPHPTAQPGPKTAGALRTQATEPQASRRRSAPSGRSGPRSELAALGLDAAALRALLAEQPSLGTASAVALREVAATGHLLRLGASEWPGFVGRLISRHGSLEQAGLALAETRGALDRRIALAPRPWREVNAIVAHTDGSAERSEALSALAASTRRAAVADFGAQLRRELGLGPAPAEAVGDLANVRDTQARLAAARAARTAAERRLAKHLELRGAVLTQPERTAFIAAFQGRSLPLIVAEAQAADALSTALAASRLPPAVLLPAYEALATSPCAEEALRWASRVAASSPALAEDERLVSLASTALEHAAAGLVLRADSPARAVSSIEALLVPFVAASNKLDRRVTAVATIVKGLGDKDDKAMAAAVQDGLKNSPLRRAVQVAALVIALSEARSNVEKERVVAALGSLASAGAVGSALLAPTAQRLAAVARELGSSAAEARLSALSALAGPASSALLSLSGLASISERLSADDKNLGTYLTVAATALCAGGSTLSALGVGAASTGAGAPLGAGKVAVGAMATAAGVILAEVGSIVDHALRAGELAAEAHALLEAANTRLAASGHAPVGADLLRLLASPDVDARRLEPLKLDGAELQAAAQAVPEVLTLPTALLGALATVATDLGLGPGEKVAFLAACREKYGSLDEASRRLADRRQSALAPVIGDEDLAQTRAQAQPSSADPDVQASTLAELVRRGHEARRLAWARAVRADLGLSPAPALAPLLTSATFDRPLTTTP